MIPGGFDGWPGGARGILKICNTSVFGASMMILHRKTRDVLAIGLLLGVYELLPAIIDYLFMSVTAVESAVCAGDDMGTLVICLIRLAVDPLVLRYMYRKVDATIDYPRTLEDFAEDHRAQRAGSAVARQP